MYYYLCSEMVFFILRIICFIYITIDVASWKFDDRVSRHLLSTPWWTVYYCVQFFCTGKEEVFSNSKCPYKTKDLEGYCMLDINKISNMRHSCLSLRIITKTNILQILIRNINSYFPFLNCKRWEMMLFVFLILVELLTITV
jgi:hypothetical protein